MTKTGFANKKDRIEDRMYLAVVLSLLSSCSFAAGVLVSLLK
jgi:hypothetical protein